MFEFLVLLYVLQFSLTCLKYDSDGADDVMTDLCQMDGMIAPLATYDTNVCLMVVFY